MCGYITYKIIIECISIYHIIHIEFWMLWMDLLCTCRVHRYYFQTYSIITHIIAHILYNMYIQEIIFSMILQENGNAFYAGGLHASTSVMRLERNLYHPCFGRSRCLAQWKRQNDPACVGSIVLTYESWAKGPWKGFPLHKPLGM